MLSSFSSKSGEGLWDHGVVHPKKSYEELIIWTDTDLEAKR